MQLKIGPLGTRCGFKRRNNIFQQMGEIQRQQAALEKRHQDKFDEAALGTEKVKDTLRQTSALKKDPFKGAGDLDQISLDAKTAAGKTTVGGASKDPVLVAVADGLEVVKGQMESGKFDEALGKLRELAVQCQDGRASQEKKRKDALLPATKKIHKDRVDQYDNLKLMIDGAYAQGLDGTGALDATNNELCASVRQMINQFSQGDKHAINAGQVRNLEDFLKKGGAGLPEGAIATSKKLAQRACDLMDGEYQARLTGATSSNAKAELLLEWGTCSGSAARKASEKGKSDSFFLRDPNGKLQYVMKPMQGESLTSADWEPGGGPVREILSSRLNDIIAKQTGGFSCRGLATDLVSLDDPTLASGSLSQSTKRVGSLQSAAPGQGKTAESLFNNVGTEATNADDSPQEVERKKRDNSEKKRVFKAKFNEDDCQAIALRHFLTFDQDAHCGNLMVDEQGPGPGQTRLIPIDAGQSLPSPEAAKRNAAALRIGTPPHPDNLNDKELLILQLPAATKPFSGAALKAIQDLDPVALARDMKAENDTLIQREPSMAGKVDPGAFDLVRKSAKFLKIAAAAGLTLYEISMVYGEGFSKVIDADANSEDAALQAALQTALYLKQQPGGIGGIEPQLMQKGFSGDKTGEIREFRQDQKERILRNGWDKAEWDRQYENDLRTTELADIARYFDPSAPESAEFPTLLANGFAGKQIAFLKLLSDHRRKGGDPQIARSLRGNDATVAYEVAQPVNSKIGTVLGGFNLWDNIGYLSEIGGVEGLLSKIAPNFLGRSLKDQIDAYRAAKKLEDDQADYLKAGGDTKLRELADLWGPYFQKKFQTANTKFEQELATWQQTNVGEQPKDPLTRVQRALPRTPTEVDALLQTDASKKLASLKELKKTKMT